MHFNSNVTKSLVHFNIPSYHIQTPIALLGERRTLDRKVAGSILTRAWCCVLEQDTSSPLLSTGKNPGSRPKMTEKLLPGE